MVESKDEGVGNNEATVSYGFSVRVPEGYDEAVIRTRLALRREGFSVLTESHVGGLLGAEAGAERQYLFMGALSSVAHKEIGSDLQVAVHFPCNVVVQESGSAALVAALDPADEAGADTPAESVAAARAALARVLSSVEEPR